MANSGSGPVEQLPGLTWLRGVAALSVMLGHYFNMLHPNTPLFLLNENAAVDIFFVLSAFTLMHVYSGEARRDWRHYALARVGRIVPLHAVMSLVMLAVCARFYGGRGGKLAYHYLEQLLLFSAWPLVGDGTNWNLVTWSLSVEWLLYIFVFPLLWIGARRLFRIPAEVALAGAVGLCALGFLVYTAWFDPRVLSIDFGRRVPTQLLSMPLRGLTAFLAGALTYVAFRAWREGPQRGLVAGCALGMTLCLVVLGQYRLVPPHAVVLAAPLLVFGAAETGTLLARLLSARPLVFLGEISYGVYLIHLPVIFGFQAALDRITGVPDYGVSVEKAAPLFWLATFSAVSIGLATASRRWFEPAAGRWVRRLGTGGWRRASA